MQEEKKGVIRQFIDSEKEDLQTIKAIFKGEAKPRVTLKEIFSGNTFKDHWGAFLLIALAFACGWFIASQYYQVLANNFVIKYCVNEFTGFSTIPENVSINMDNFFNR